VSVVRYGAGDHPGRRVSARRATFDHDNAIRRDCQPTHRGLRAFDVQQRRSLTAGDARLVQFAKRFINYAKGGYVFTCVRLLSGLVKTTTDQFFIKSYGMVERNPRPVD